MKTLQRQEVKEIITKIKAEGKTIVFSNGCFDILHAGHVRYLAEAKKLGDYLIIGLNSDLSVRLLKGADRPINSEEDRSEVLGALAVVDFVVIFSENTAEELVKEIQPQVYVKGGDYQVKDLPEAAIVADYGGQTVLIPEVAGKSSSIIISKIKQH